MVQAWWPGNTKLSLTLLRNQFNVLFISQQRHFSVLCVNFLSSPFILPRHSTNCKMCRLRSAAMDSVRPWYLTGATFQIIAHSNTRCLGPYCLSPELGKLAHGTLQIFSMCSHCKQKTNSQAILQNGSSHCQQVGTGYGLTQDNGRNLGVSF